MKRILVTLILLSSIQLAGNALAAIDIVQEGTSACSIVIAETPIPAARLAAYELQFCLGWDPAETTLISLGTGRGPHTIQPGEADRYYAWNWITPVLDAFLDTANVQQVHLVSTLFKDLDFRRFQVDMREPIGMDGVDHMEDLIAYGEELGKKILADETDPIPDLSTMQAPRS